MRSITDWKTDKMKVVPAELSNVACHAIQSGNKKFLRKGLRDRSWFAALMKWLTTHYTDSALRNTATAHLDLHVIILSTN